jgi:hypothetical protein
MIYEGTNFQNPIYPILASLLTTHFSLITHTELPDY